MTLSNHDLQSLWCATEQLFTALSPLPGFHREARADHLACWSPVVDPVANYVLRASGPAAIDAVLARAGGRGFVWKVAPQHAQADALTAALRRRGFEELPATVAVVGTIPDNLAPYVASIAGCRRVDDLPSHQAWLRPFCGAFGVSDQTGMILAAAGQVLGYDAIENHYLERDGVPVACGSLIVGEDGLGAVFNLAVDPACTRRGFGTAMLAALAVRARALGAHRLGQFSTPEGVPLYAHHGTVHAARVHQFLIPATAEVPCDAPW